MFEDTRFKMLGMSYNILWVMTIFKSSIIWGLFSLILFFKCWKRNKFEMLWSGDRIGTRFFEMDWSSKNYESTFMVSSLVWHVEPYWLNKYKDHSFLCESIYEIMPHWNRKFCQKFWCCCKKKSPEPSERMIRFSKSGGFICCTNFAK